jgi:uncharacterized protein Yka (UPF0111/DUF47 family)
VSRRSLGCGGGDGDPLTRAALASEASAICRKYESKLDALAKPNSIEEVASLAEDAKPIVEDGVDKLADLQPPEDLEDEYDRLIAFNRESVLAIEDLREATAGGDRARVQRIVQNAETKEREADTLARQIGLAECAND